MVTSTDEVMELEGITVTDEEPLRVALVIVRVPTGVGVGVGAEVGVGVGVLVGVGVGVGVKVGVGVFVGEITVIPFVKVKALLLFREQPSSLQTIKLTLYVPLLAGAVMVNVSS